MARAMKKPIDDINNQDIQDKIKFGAHIKVVGVGGSGGNAIDHMINSGVSGVDFIVVNCDVQDLSHSKAEKKIHIGKNLTKGLGAGMDPEIGRQAAEETKDEIQDALKAADMVFVTCGLGGGTGTGASPIVAEAARSQGSLTLAVVTRPFSFEGAERRRIAEEGLKNLLEVVDTVIAIPNDRLLQISDQKTTLKNAFALCDDVLKNAVQGISELLVKPGIINVDFADIKTIMAEAGPAIMGIGQSTGENRAVEAAKKAITSPLLDISIEGARGVLFAVTGGDDLTLFEINEAAKIITASSDPQAKIIFGAFKDDTLPKGAIKITVIAAGFENKSSNIITKERKGFDADADAEAESNFNKDEDDKHIPAFMRRALPAGRQGKSPPIDKSGTLRIKNRINREFLKNYHDKFQPSRPAMAGRDFHIEDKARILNFGINDIASFLKKVAEIFLSILGFIVIVIAGLVYKTYKLTRSLISKARRKILK